MAKETAAAKRSRISGLLAMYDAKNRELAKLAKEVDQMKAEIRDTVEPGTYGDWVRAAGTPREILDQRAAKDALTKAGLPIPTKTTDAPIIVTPAVK